jgi:hypothetical protein
MTHSGAHLDLSAFSSPEELASLGLNRLKSALQALGIKCGGLVFSYWFIILRVSAQIFLH